MICKGGPENLNLVFFFFFKKRVKTQYFELQHILKKKVPKRCRFDTFLFKTSIAQNVVFWPNKIQKENKEKA